MCRARAEVLAAQAIAVAFQGENRGVMDEPIDHRGGSHVIAEGISPQAEKDLLDVTIIEARS